MPMGGDKVVAAAMAYKINGKTERRGLGSGSVTASLTICRPK